MITHISLVASNFVVKIETLHYLPISSISNSCHMPQEAICLDLEGFVVVRKEKP